MSVLIWITKRNEKKRSKEREKEKKVKVMIEKRGKER
jgi:hypothetical protein